VRNDGTPVAIPAVLQISQISQRDDANSVKINFVAVQPYWEPITVPVVATQVFESDGLRQSTLLDVMGEFPTSPTLRVMATAQRSSKTATVGWQYRRKYTIANTGADPITNYPIAIDIGSTTALVSGSKALSSGNDLRVVYQGKEIARTLTDWNSGSFNTLVWIVIPYLAAGASMTYDVLYGNASAGAPPTLLTGIDLPAFDIAVAGANRSSNTKWIYLADRTAANAGLGGWYGSSGTAPPTVKFSVPGAWNMSTMLLGNDDRSQQAYSSYVATGTKYHQIFDARRAKAGSTVVTEHNGADSVYLRNPVGIASVRCDLRLLNMAKGDTDTTPIGQVGIYTRNRQGEAFAVLYENSTLTDPEATIATATYTPAAAVKEVYFGVTPYPIDAVKNLSIDPKARNDRYVNAAWYTTLEVNVQSGVLTTTNSEAEVHVYEFATALRYGGGGASVGVPPYKTVRLGNYLGASGVGTPRLTAPLNKQVVVFMDTRKTEQWNVGVTAKELDMPLGAVNALDVVLDGSGNTIEQQSADWMPLLPTVNPLANPDFEADASNWTKTFGHASATTTLARSTSVFVTTPASLALTVASSTVPTLTQVAAVSATDLLPIGNRQSVYVGAGLYTTNVNLIPRLTITFYDASAAVLSTVTMATWTPPASAWRRRALAARRSCRRGLLVARL
jgi:hypothetical protein